MAASRKHRTGSDVPLLELNRRLQQTIRRARRQRQRAEATNHIWTETLDEAICLASKIARTPAHGLPGIAVKVSALRWFLDETDAVLDLTALRQLRALGREVARLTRA